MTVRVKPQQAGRRHAYVKIGADSEIADRTGDQGLTGKRGDDPLDARCAAIVDFTHHAANGIWRAGRRGAARQQHYIGGANADRQPAR